jgi:Flp pilus assembly pilin Flp
MVEYALIISFVALVVIASLMIFGPAVASIFNKATASLT